MRFTSEFWTADFAFRNCPAADYENQSDFGKGWYRVCRDEAGMIIAVQGPFSKAGILQLVR